MEHFGFQEIFFGPQTSLLNNPAGLPRRYFLADDWMVTWDGDAYPEIDHVEDFVLNAKLNDIYADADEEFNRQFWAHPQILYHATKETYAADIETQGLIPRNLSRGLSNRWMGAAVFTVEDSELLLDGSYGEVIFAIDCPALKTALPQDALPFVTRDPAIQEQSLRARLAHALGTEPPEIVSASEGIWESTVVFHGPIPPFALRREDTHDLMPRFMAQ